MAKKKPALKKTAEHIPEQIPQLHVATLLLDVEAAMMHARAACLRKDHRALFDRLMESRALIIDVLNLLISSKSPKAEYALATGNPDAKAQRAVTSAAKAQK